ncbi:MAG: HAD family hydrolase [Betaproteobacteria bacterium]|jgi:2-phosphoglycolate phosphatase|nr:HAD-IA family hydrolase [Rhodocyclaceae bacterium]MCA3135547.1 HAD-IA family hydrolase [Rhodocyclaceae bacterium]MCA3143827.1 HAD-IA family hydrolase [Rhodocyclaceae bacterium]MCA3146083.1 HAD-IA family hydrolase [Rhodocyclaceae bacterium]MCE2897054.1 HAD-IA family hydrolase [Betaproteobacteria bacterium]
MIRAVLFDLDGTLADTAPDLGGALNRMRARRGLGPMPIEVLRTHASSGARGMIGAGLGVTPADPAFPGLRDEFLDEYESELMRDSVLFPGVPELLDGLESAGYAWGVVTNKVERFTVPLVKLLGLSPRSPCIVAGDTTPHPKPHPAPLIEAARRLAAECETCVYVGDDLRDVQAARAARMGAVVAGYGYLGEGEPPERWGADHLIAHPEALLELLAGMR